MKTTTYDTQREELCAALENVWGFEPEYMADSVFKTGEMLKDITKDDGGAFANLVAGQAKLDPFYAVGCGVIIGAALANVWVEGLKEQAVGEGE